MTEVFDYTTSYAYTVFRGINRARQFSVNSPSDTQIMDAASNYPENDKCELAIALEDFSEKFKNFHGKNNSNISAEDCKRKGFGAWLENMGWKKPVYENIYETPDMQKYMEDKGNIFQDDIFSHARAAEDGIKYAKSGDDIYQSALNFAKADIGAIEEANYQANFEVKKNGKLDYYDISTYANSDKLFLNFMEDLDLDGNPKNITAEEYASFLLVADGCYVNENSGLGTGYDPDTKDGLITNDEALVLKNLSNSDIKQYAQTIYDTHYKK